MTPKEQEENLQKRIDKYNITKETTPIFSFMQEVIVNEGFYKGYKGKIYKEIDFMPHPDQENHKDEGVVISYEVIINDNDEAVIDRRIVEAKYMSKYEQESFKLPTAQEAVDNIKANMSSLNS